ncbi:DUF6056 family protein [uncultured Methanobrevibacter sp.]|uniref:DUF6056 family protein n=1 Tax=uncultured Methanobrevibacter sp. TaxID=253161 RepID=UPI002600FBAE|nr:DUF6056 family protein [uncultured Methanobrevibacter sp.]
MNINKDKSKLTQFIKNNLPIIGFFILMLALHKIMSFIGDDIWYAKILSNQPLVNFLSFRYYEWSSRLLIDCITVILAKENYLIWKILDIILYTLGVYLLIKFINKDNLNYLWCFVFAMISFIPLINEINGKKTNIFIYIISILSLIYAVNQEQSCLLILGINASYLLYCIIKKKNISKFNVLIVIISALTLTMILTSPGNDKRVIAETARFYVEYANFGIIEKLYLGTIPTIGILLKDKILFTVFYIILNASALLKIKNKNLKYILYFNIILILFLIFFKTLIDITSIPNYLNIELMHNPIVVSAFSTVDSITKSMPLINDTIHLFTYKGLPNAITAPVVLAVLISIYLILSSCWMIFKTFGKEQLFPLILFIVGFMTRLAVGFSPTVFASGSRTAFFFYITIITVTLMLIKKLFDENTFNKTLEKRITIILAIIGLFTYMGVFAIVYVMF